MAINDIYTLPKNVMEVPQVKEVLQAEQMEIDTICDYILNLLKELNVNSTTELISRHEQIFDLKNSANESIEERRAKIIAKLNSRGMTTTESIAEIARILTECECSVTEKYDEYAFIINVEYLPSEESEKLKYLLVQVGEVKPAHLSCTVHLVYNTYGDLTPYTYGELGAFTYKELREKRLKHGVSKKRMSNN